MARAYHDGSRGAQQPHPTSISVSVELPDRGRECLKPRKVCSGRCVREKFARRGPGKESVSFLASAALANWRMHLALGKPRSLRGLALQESVILGTCIELRISTTFAFGANSYVLCGRSSNALTLCPNHIRAHVFTRPKNAL